MIVNIQLRCMIMNIQRNEEVHKNHEYMQSQKPLIA